MQMKEWNPSQLAPGDAVVVTGMFIADRLDTVERLTPTHIVLAGSDIHFRRRDGYEVGGDSYRSKHLRQATPTRVASIRRAQAVHRLSNIMWSKLPDSTLAEVLRLLPKDPR